MTGLSCPLSLAINCGSFDVAEWLINAGADLRPRPNSLRGFGQIVPLVAAVGKGDARPTKLMIEKGAKVNVILEKHNMPLPLPLDSFWRMCGVAYPLEVTRVILVAGANVNVTAIFGRTPLGKAAQLGMLKQHDF